MTNNQSNKTLEEELKMNTAALVSTLKEFDLGIYVMDIVKERDAIHAKHHAQAQQRIEELEGENREILEGINRIMETDNHHRAIVIANTILIQHTS